MAELLPATFAALGAVIGLILGGILGRIFGAVLFGLSDLSDLIFAASGGLACAVVCAWLGLRLSRRFANPS